ncbi:Chemotaxis protein PomA [Candidatus Methanoperedenaceae archaeon GB37]|nr:Chemotaxis protein PomA [Candidatus Methanoperedenaceae archaeon GB37]
MADKARREGILSLEGFIKDSHDEFLKYGLRLCVDGVEPQSIKQILEKDIKSSSERHELGVNIFLSMGSYAPAFGMIGTLIGLVQMLAKLDDPSNIGPAMAVALITTFYGALLANAVFLPIAGKLKTKSEEEIFVKKIMLEGIMGIS